MVVLPKLLQDPTQLTGFHKTTKNCRPTSFNHLQLHDLTRRKRLGKIGVPGRIPRRKPKLVSYLSRNTVLIHKTSGQTLCGLMRQRLNYLEAVWLDISGVNLHFIIRTSHPFNCGGGGSVWSWLRKIRRSGLVKVWTLIRLGFCGMRSFMLKNPPMWLN